MGRDPFEMTALATWELDADGLPVTHRHSWQSGPLLPYVSGGLGWDTPETVLLVCPCGELLRKAIPGFEHDA